MLDVVNWLVWIKFLVDGVSGVIISCCDFV